MTLRRPHRPGILAWAALALLTIGAGSAQFEAPADFEFEPYGSLTVLTPEVSIGETARIEVAVRAGADFGFDLVWGDGTVTFVDNQPQPDVRVYQHAYASAGTRVVQLIEFDFPADTGVIVVRAPALVLDAARLAVGERLTAAVDAGPFGGALDWGDGTRTALAGGDQDLEHAYAATGNYLVQVQDAAGSALAFALVEVVGPALRVRPTSAAVGESVTAEVTAAPAGATLDWGDGTRVGLAAGDGERAHAYAAPGVYVVRLEDATGVPVDAATVSVGLDTALRLSTTAALIGDTVSAEVTAAPAGGLLDWGDGTRTTLGGGDQVLAHAYAAAGAYRVRLLDAAGSVLALELVGVTRGELGFDVPAIAAVGTPAIVEIAGLATNAPFGAQIAWGDGNVTTVTADGAFAHAYGRTGTFLVRLTGLPGGAPLAAAAIAVDAAGTLSLEGAARLFEPLTWVGEGLAPGFAYAFDLGDGTVVTAVADGLGRARVAHTYRTPVDRIDATLTLVEGGQRRLLDTVRVPLELPAGGEALALRVVPNVAEGRFDVEATASGLLPGLTYVIASPSFGSAEIAADPSGGASASFDLLASVDTLVAAALAVRVEQRGGGALEFVRAEAAAQVAWPRGAEALDVEGAVTPILTSDTVSIRATGLVPGYAYELVVAGDTARPYRLGRASDAEWQVDLPMAFFGERFDVELFARYPVLAQFGAPEARAALTLAPIAPTGSLALPARVVPFGVPSPILVRDLTPGVAYRVEIEGEAIARFVATDDGAVDLEHPLRSSAAIDLFVDRPLADLRPIASVAPGGITFVGTLGYTFETQDYLDTGEVTLQLRGVVPGFTHVIALGDGRRIEVVAAEDGTADLRVADPGLEAFLVLRAFGDEFFVARTRLDGLPPRVLAFHGIGNWHVRVTSLDAPFVAPASRDALSGHGVLEGFVVGGRLQDPVPMRFERLSVLPGGFVRSGFADLVEPRQLQLPFALRGVELSLTTLRLTTFGTPPDLRGTVALPTGEVEAFDRVMLPSQRSGDGFMVSVLSRGPGLALGGSGLRFASGGFAVVDLSTETNYNLRRDDGRFALDHAYDAYTEVGRPSPAREQGANWVGVLYTDAELSVGGAASGATTTFVGDVAWTSAGASTYVGRPLGDADRTFRLGGWTFRDVTGLELLVVDGQLLRFTRPSGTVRLDWFGQTVPVAFRPAWHGWTVHTLAPIAQDYGSTAIVGGFGTFVRTGPDRLSLRLPNALWALDGDLAAEPATVDGSSGERLLASLPDEVDVSDDLRELYADSLATAETALNLYRLQLLLKDLTLHPDGSVDLGGRDWQTLARIPALDMFGFPYLGASAEIGVRSDGGGTYRVGLRGDLKLGDVVEATAAPSWFVHRDGRQTQWRFEGVGAKFGDYEDSQVKFSLVVGGVIDLEHAALSFTGGGSLTISEVISIEAMALFGVVGYDGPRPDVFWFVTAGVDLGEMERPINVKVNGVDVLAFYVFRGGIASHLRIDVGGGDCRVDDGNVPEGRLPSIAANALDCYDPDLKLSLLAGTVIGSPAPSGMPPDGYGKLWHLDADLVVNLGRGGDLQLAGKGWMGLNLGEGYRRRAIEQPQLAGRLLINAAGITGSMCAGPLASAAGILDCSGLAKAEIRVAGILLAELRGAIEFKASWSQRQYYFALGTVRNPLYMYVIPKFSQAYFVIGYITDFGILHPNVRLPAGGVWLGAQAGFTFDWSDSGNFICNWSAYANASFGYGGALGLQVVPRFRMSASATIWGSASAGARVCGKGVSVSASVRATGTLSAPSPTEFRGDIEVKIKLPRVKDIDVTVRDQRLVLR